MKDHYKIYANDPSKDGGWFQIIYFFVSLAAIFLIAYTVKTEWQLSQKRIADLERQVNDLRQLQVSACK